MPRIKEKAGTKKISSSKMYFKKYIAEQMAPGKGECEAFINMFKIDRDWKAVKYLVKNLYYTCKANRQLPVG